MNPYADPEILQETITDEIFKAIGLPVEGRLRRLLGPLFGAPTRRFVTLMAQVDRRVAEDGFAAGAAVLAEHFARVVHVSGAEHIPLTGPLVVATNHPGAFDSAVLSAAIGRADLKVIATGAHFLRHLPAVASHLFLVSEEQPQDRMAAFRGALRHLQAGGALLLFATGRIDPDPDVLPGAEQALDAWSGSLEMFARRVKGLRVVPAIIRGVMDPGWAHSPLVRIRSGMARRRLAEFFQIMQQVVRPGSIGLEPRVAFGEAIDAASGGEEVMEAAREAARRMLREGRVDGIRARQDKQDKILQDGQDTCKTG